MKKYDANAFKASIFIKYLYFFTGTFSVSRAYFFVFCPVHFFASQGHDFTKNINGKLALSRALFAGFSVFFTGTFFVHGHNFRFF